MLTTIELNHNEPIAFICSPRLGDTLISLVVVHNLVKAGYVVEVYGDAAYELREWFPWADIHPVTTLMDAKAKLGMYHVVLHMYESELSKSMQVWHARSIVLAHSLLFHARISMVDIQVSICKEVLKLPPADVVRSNNIKPLTGIKHREYLTRIAIHPTSGEDFRSWPAKKFISLANILKQRGFLPKFIVSPSERNEWQRMLGSNSADLLPEFSSLSDVASFIYESGWFIGNDSGIGHLASNLGIPTLSLILRPGLARQWRPSFSSGDIVLPPAWLITRPLKEKFWKYCVSVKKVLDDFDELRIKTCRVKFGAQHDL